MEERWSRARVSHLFEGVGYRIYMEKRKYIIYCKDTIPRQRFIFTFIWKWEGNIDTRTN